MVAYSDKAVVILGAGTSAPWGLPVMASFMNRARRQSQEASGLMRRSYDVMLGFWSRCRGTSWALQRHWDNIEELYTQADLLRLTGSTISVGGESLSAEEVCRHISWCIWDVYRTFQHNRIDWNQIARNIEEEGLQLAAITTNYDLAVEESLLSFGAQFNPYYPGFQHDRDAAFRGMSDARWADIAYSTSGHNGAKLVPVVKLHGSVNWFQSDADCVCMRNRQQFAQNREQLQGFTFHRDELVEIVRRNLSAEWTETFYPAIVPPMLGKMSNSDVISRNWTCAVELLQRARYVLVIGYSFPLTDAFMLRLLTEGLYENHDLERFVIIDLQGREAWERRIRTMFDPVFATHSLLFFNCDSRTALDILQGSKPKDWPAMLHNNRLS